MRIDLFYYTPYFNDYYFVYGPEKDSNGDIIIKPTGYYFADVNDMVAKLRSMADSLAPEITNVQARNQGNSFWIYVGDLNIGSSDVPDYTQILTNINTNLTNLNSNFLFKVSDSEQYSFVEVLIKIFNCLSTTYIGNSDTLIRQNSVVSNLQNISNKLTASNYSIAQIMLSSIGSTLGAILSALKLTSNPAVSVTDVISALNATIDSKQDTTIVNNEVTPLAEINIDVPFEVKNLKKSDVENL